MLRRWSGHFPCTWPCSFAHDRLTCIDPVAPGLTCDFVSGDVLSHPDVSHRDVPSMCPRVARGSLSPQSAETFPSRMLATYSRLQFARLATSASRPRTGGFPRFSGNASRISVKRSRRTVSSWVRSSAMRSRRSSSVRSSVVMPHMVAQHCWQRKCANCVDCQSLTELPSTLLAKAVGQHKTE